MNDNLYKIESNHVMPEKGKILVAEPFLTGSYFNRAIVLLVEHSDEGALGFILNKEVEVPIEKFYDEFPQFYGEIFIGGPMKPNCLNYIHTLGDKLPGSYRVVDNLYWGGDMDVMKQLIKKGEVDVNQIRFFLGYSGWSSKQLYEELLDDSWLVATADVQQIMNCNTNLWKETVKKIGGKYAMWENFPENPTLN